MGYIEAHLGAVWARLEVLLGFVATMSTILAILASKSALMTPFVEPILGPTMDARAFHFCNDLQPNNLGRFWVCFGAALGAISRQAWGRIVFLLGL